MHINKDNVTPEKLKSFVFVIIKIIKQDAIKGDAQKATLFFQVSPTNAFKS